MASFKGTYNHTLDPKNRFNIPAKMRNAFLAEDKETVTLTRGYDQCVFIYSFTEWQKVEAQMRDMAVLHSETRKFIRLISGFAQEDHLDKQGRVVIPQTLLEYARIEKDIIIGMLNWIEVWNPKIYEELHRDFNLEAAAEKMLKLV